MTKEEAIEVYNGLINTKIREAFEFFVPELRESEGERIRKAIIEAVKYYWSDDEQAMADCLAYLEKQKEQRSLNISAASEWLRKNVCHYMNSEYNEFHKCVEYDGSIDKETLINDFEEAMQKEQKQEWSEEDEEKINSISEIIEHCTAIPYSGGTLTLNKERKKELQGFIESLRPQQKKL